MTETNYIKNYKTDCSRFSGEIYPSDFETTYPNTMSYMASRIASDIRFDEICRKNLNNKKNKEIK